MCCVAFENAATTTAGVTFGKLQRNLRTLYRLCSWSMRCKLQRTRRVTRAIEAGASRKERFTSFHRVECVAVIGNYDGNEATY